ncbi:MAG: beta-ketoacyl-[acyl-carrier-protein] synthase II, partial [Dehalococcoidia bacterium]|nr:beta-ketoacyl-[acyl-carrier-protein] synthase II [Dehalococcoidia bacterium]
MNKRVVVTGMGVVTPLGLDLPSTWQGLINGKSGITRITSFDPTEFSTQIAGEVKGFDPKQYFAAREARRMDPFTHFTVVASQEAVKQASLKINASNANDIGVIIGNNKGGIITLCQQMEVLSKRGPRRISPFLIPMMMVNRAAAEVAAITGAKGCNFTTASACASGANAIGEAFHVIKRGDANVMITGGCEAAITPIIVAAFSSMKALSSRNDEPQRASRPFDADRDGFVLAEGGAALVLEEREHAIQR